MTRTTRLALRRRTIHSAFATALFTALAGASCSAGDPLEDPAEGQGGSLAQSSVSSSAGGEIGAGGSIDPSTPPQGPYADFPATPILDTPMGGAAPPANAPELFGPAGSGDAAGGPCLVEPTPGTLYPNNWLRPRFRFQPVGKQNLFEIRIKAASDQINELLVYTSATEWKMPGAMWKALTAHLRDVPMTVSIRGAELKDGALTGKPSVGTSGEIRIASAAASGSIVYWRTVKASGSGELKGFSVGDESVARMLTAEQVKLKPGGKSVKCIGCHSSTPDGKFAAFKTLANTFGGAIAAVDVDNVGAPPQFWSMASMQSMDSPLFGVPTFSQAHWQPGDRTLLTSWGSGFGAQLAWFDLEAQASGQGMSFGLLERDTDDRGAILPTWSHDGKKIVYISTDGSHDGYPAGGDTDLFSVPYGEKKGGAAAPVAGAADPAQNEYYPAFSPDDRFIAFNRVNKGQTTYSQGNAEVFVLPADGGTATRLAANDPIACSGKKSPGVTNSWPKWAPEAVTVKGRTYYWLTFSSTRDNGLPQLYMTAMVVEGGQITTYPALYLWNQPSDEPNHTPAWDVFKLPPIEPPR